MFKDYSFHLFVFLQSLPVIFMLVFFVVVFQPERKRVMQQEVMKVCEETGMYLTEGKAMSCRVLKDQRG